MKTLVWFLLVILIASNGADICGEDKCTCETEHNLATVRCFDLQFKHFPNLTDLPENTIVLDLTRNEIASLDLIDEIDGLKTLSLAFNEIADIKPNTFEKYSYLLNLDLSNNQLAKLDVDALSGLAGLRVLNLSRNYLRKLPDALLHRMPMLKELHLYGNPMHMIRYEFLQESDELTILDISNTGLTYLDAGVFHTLQKLEELDLSGNNFEEIPSKAISSASRIKVLKLNRDRFAVVSDGAFKSLMYLETLEICDSDTLSVIESGAFRGLKSLKVLRVTSNPQLKTLDFGAFNGLYSSVNNNWTLVELHLRSNGLQTIQAPSAALCYIGLVDLQENPWTCDCTLAWITKCTLRSELTRDLTCAFPKRHNGRILTEMDAEDYVCESTELMEHQQKVLRVVVIASGAIGIFLCGLIVIVVIKRHQITEWWYYRKRGSGAVYYVKADNNSNEVQDA